MVVWIVEGLAFEHGAGDGEEPVGDRAQRPAVGMATGPERGVSFTAGAIMLDGDAGPVVDGTAQTHVAGFAHDDDAALAAAAGHGRDAGQASEGPVVSVAQRPGRFCEQRGEDDPSDPGRGAQDLHVALLGLLPRGLVSLAGDGPAQGVDPLVGLPELAVDQAQAFADGADVGASGLDGAGGGGDGFLAQDAEQARGIDLADTSGPEELGDAGLADAAGFTRIC